MKNATKELESIKKEKRQETQGKKRKIKEKNGTGKKSIRNNMKELESIKKKWRKGRAK